MARLPISPSALKPARRIELLLPSHQEGGLPLTYAGKKFEPVAGVDPARCRIQIGCSTLSYTGVVLVRWIEHRPPTYEIGALPTELNQPNEQTGGASAELPEGGGCTSAVQFWTFTMSNSAMPRRHRNQTTARAPKRTNSNLGLRVLVVLRTIWSLLPCGGGCGLRRLPCCFSPLMFGS